MAKKIPYNLNKHGHTRVDHYFWLRDRDHPEVRSYLEAENERAARAIPDSEQFEEKIFTEIKGRIKADDNSVPYRRDGYYYYTRFELGKEYGIYARKEGDQAAHEQVMLDANLLANGHEFFSLGGWAVSTGQDILAYAIDTTGRRIYTTHFKNLTTGELYSETLTNVTENFAWANDNRTLFYTKQDPVTLRAHQIWRHVLGTDQADDELVYEEGDETFSCYVFKTKSKRYLMIVSAQTLTHEYRFVDADKPLDDFSVILPRERGHEYQVEHFGDEFIIRTNDQADNFRLMAVSVDDCSKANWRELIAHRPRVYLADFELFRDYLVLEEREHGLTQLRIIPWAGGEDHTVAFPEPAYQVFLDINLEFDSEQLRFNYSSLKTPHSVFDYHMATRHQTLLKREEVLGGFDASDYIVERHYAPAPDGTAVPISLIYRQGLKKDGANPLLLYGYGSYGLSIDAGFSSPRFSLIDRGFIYAIAHVRGGQELGRLWYEDGRLFKKKNTFTDFIACAEYLIDQKLTCAAKLFAMGRSAGGLLMGVVANMRPDLFKGIVAEVPFVDVVTTMLDASIPLTTGEYDEWGDPHNKDYYDYMLSYSPYDNIAGHDYPNMLITGGLHDSQVQYWEPAKWSAKLRELKTDDNLILLKTNMDAGHGGASGRFRRHRETAFSYVFLLHLAGIHS